ncbi:unnamed protein product [Allacma fusca]|uniref:PPM-type phosphatase domain-containing protein n=1 Tax=Allacma fusca TaxID=39272 RepID=A0A8J2PS15_9HEXA|nr:unnamed protein product [Allacma fusca]
MRRTERYSGAKRSCCLEGIALLETRRGSVDYDDLCSCWFVLSTKEMTMRRCLLCLCRNNAETIHSTMPLTASHLHPIKHTSSHSYQFIRSYVRLSPNEVSRILRRNEFSADVNLGSVKSFDTNQLASNTPIEDARSEARCLLTTGLLFGVFDGHGGPACGQVVAKRLFRYIAASLLPRDVLHNTMNPASQGSNGKNLLGVFNDRYDLVEDLSKLYEQSFQEFVKHLAEESDDFRMNSAIEKSFLRLDNDLSKEAFANGNKNDSKEQKEDSKLALKTMSVALSGAVACVTHIDGEHLHVANCGDCRAVLGSRSSEVEDWVAVPLTMEHNSENISEVKRILSEHPENESDTVIRNERLLGQLAPLRAFGDYRFKWTLSEIRELVVPYLGEQALSSNYLTPPYLTSRPEVTYHKLRVKDSFLIIASDGLWDMLSPSQAVRLVGEHQSGKTVLSPYKLPENQGHTLGDVHNTLLKRMESFKLKPTDQNAATHLIRHALGGTEHGIDHNKMSNLLTLPEDTVRLFRDDITVTVIFFDPEYLSQRPL